MNLTIKSLKQVLIASTVAMSGMCTSAMAADKFFVYVSPDAIGVNAFLRMGQVGTEIAGLNHNAEVKTYESRSAEQRRENVEAAINEGADLIVLLGFEFNDILAELAPTAPDIQFLIVDQCLAELPANVHCAVFREYEASYLAGIMAGLLTETNKVGVVSALDIPFLHRFTDAYRDGAKFINPDVDVQIRWVGGDNPFSDPVRAKEQALAMVGAGADVIYSATAGGDFGVFEGAKEQNFKVLSVDVNQCPNAPGYIVDNALKGVDKAIIQSVDVIMKGEKSTVFSAGLKEGGMNMFALLDDEIKGSKCTIADHPDIVKEVKKQAQRIISGELVLEDPMFAQ